MRVLQVRGWSHLAGRGMTHEQLWHTAQFFRTNQHGFREPGIYARYGPFGPRCSTAEFERRGGLLRKTWGDQENECRGNVHVPDRSGDAAFGSGGRSAGGEASRISGRITEGCRRISREAIALRGGNGDSWRRIASAITLATAACMMAANGPGTGDAMPTNLEGLKDEVLVQKAHRYDYDHSLRNCGIRFVNVETLKDYEAAFSKKTVMCHFYNAADAGEISRQDWIRVAHAHGIPCFNDAAADVPPISNLWNYTQMGFDLVAFSGGKGIRGPQNAGLLLGKKQLIDAAKLNNSPHSNTVGRGMKVAKEEIIGLVAAVDWFLSQDDAALEAEFRRRAERIADRVKSIPSVKTQVFIPPVANHVPHLLITYDQDRVKITGAEVMQKMRQGTPRIELNPATGGGSASAGLPQGPNTIVVGAWMLQPGEDLVVARRLHEVLHEAAS